jgi:hypothetical protein
VEAIGRKNIQPLRAGGLPRDAMDGSDHAGLASAAAEIVHRIVRHPVVCEYAIEVFVPETVVRAVRQRLSR